MSSSKERFNEVEPLWLFGKPDDYGEADASNMEYCAEFVQMRCDVDITVAQARALRDWLNRALPAETEGNAALFDKIMKAIRFGLGRGSPTLEQEIRAALRLPEKSGAEPVAPVSSNERVEEIRKRVAADYANRVAWSEWSQAEKDRAMLLDILDASRPAVSRGALQQVSNARAAWTRDCRCSCSGCAAFDSKLLTILTQPGAT